MGNIISAKIAHQKSDETNVINYSEKIENLIDEAISNGFYAITVPSNEMNRALEYHLIKLGYSISVDLERTRISW